MYNVEFEAPYSRYAVYEMHYNKGSFRVLAFVAIHCAVKVIQNAMVRREVSGWYRPERRCAV